MSVTFDPTLRKFGTEELAGYYAYDDESVKAQRVTVVDKGILKTFLLSRAPLAGFPQSNGHGRAQSGYAPVSRQSNLIVESSQSMPYDKLIERLENEIRSQGKPFGLLFDNIEGGFTFTGRSIPNAFAVIPTVVHRVYADNRPPELVRGVDLIGTPLAAFSKIVATSDKQDVFNGVCGAESGGVPVAARRRPCSSAKSKCRRRRSRRKCCRFFQPLTGKSSSNGGSHATSGADWSPRCGVRVARPGAAGSAVSHPAGHAGGNDTRSGPASAAE